MTPDNIDKPTYEEFRAEWLGPIALGVLTPFEKGVQFSTKIVTQWLDITEDDGDFHQCDGAGDGGIDIAYLKRADIQASDADLHEGDTWYLIQSKYGTAFAGTETILSEGNKVIDTLTGENHPSERTAAVVAKLDLFRAQASPVDRIVLIFATVDPIAEHDRQALENIKIVGRERVGEMFDVQELSLRTIWETLDDSTSAAVSVPLRGEFIRQSTGLLVGVTSLVDLFAFLTDFQQQTGNLDHLYDRNVRQFLGGRGRINRAIEQTLQNSPEKFGLYNNGITIVTDGYEDGEEGTVILRDPYIVNGCQTTRTIWRVLDIRLNPGGSGTNEQAEEWKQRAREGGVVTKIVTGGEHELPNITRYTNSQNAVRQQDFLTLERDFSKWKQGMEEQYDIFLEVQRGGIDARRAYERGHVNEHRFADYVNAFELIKVYGAGWLSQPGTAFGKNAPFVPGGPIYNRIISTDERQRPFDVRDLYAAYIVKGAADKIVFGRRSESPSRRQSKFLFYHIFIEITKNAILLTPDFHQGNVSPDVITDALIKLAESELEAGLDLIATAAVNVVDAYLTSGSDQSAYNEETLVSVHNGDLNAFLKADNLGKETHSPRLVQLLAIHKAAFQMHGQSQVAQALTMANAPSA